jgi:hypothetical protein
MAGLLRYVQRSCVVVQWGTPNPVILRVSRRIYCYV